jgi:membrane-associated phospholipid phosphatase
MEVVYALQAFASPFLDTLMTIVTDLGSEEAYIALVVLVYLGIDARAGQRLGVLLLLSFFVNQYAKAWFDTPRPFELDPEVLRTERALVTAQGPGFPSGHAQGAATFWGYAAVLVGRAWFWPVALLLIALVATSRLYLGVHVPADVVGGLAIGALLVLMAAIIDRSGVVVARPLLALLAVVGPLGLHLQFPTPDSDLLAGALTALVLGPMLFRHRTDGSLLGRFVVVLIGLGLVFTVLVASSALLPEEIKRDAYGGYLRYLVLGLSGTLVAPWIGQTFGLVPIGVPPAGRGRIPPRRGGLGRA